MMSCPSWGRRRDTGLPATTSLEVGQRVTLLDRDGRALSEAEVGRATVHDHRVSGEDRTIRVKTVRGEVAVERCVVDWPVARVRLGRSI